MVGRKLINIPVLVVTLVLLIVGYVLLSKGPVASDASWKYAPVILVAVYSVLIPLSVLLQSKEK